MYMSAEYQRTEYAELLQEVEPRLIRGEDAHRAMVAKFELLATRYEDHPSEDLGQMLELIATLIEHYEAREFPAPKVAPRELVQHLLDERGLTRAAFARELDCARSTITNILSGNRAISKAMALQFSRFFNLPLEAFVEA
jgi:HTH-type transcriptional regulator/antitoxin HigA